MMKKQNKAKINLLIFIYSLGDGGAERVSTNLANYWAIQGWEITIVTLAPQSMDLFELHPAINRISLDLVGDSANVLDGLWQSVRRVIALRQVLRQIQPDIALSIMTTANIILALATWGLSGIKTIGSERSHPPQLPLSYLWEILRCHTYRLLNTVIVLSSEGKDWIVNNTNAKKVAVIFNPVSWPLPLYEPQLTPPQSQQRILLAAGRLIELKGFTLLIEAFSSLADKYPEWDLIIVGDGSLRDSLEEQLVKLSLKNRVFLPGRAGNIGEWYEKADLYVLSSRVEGFPNTLVEAMAHGLAAVSFDCDTGPRDIIRHEVDGLLVKAGDLPELSNALDRLMGDNALRKQFSEKALEVRERFSMPRIISMWEKLFDELLDRSLDKQ